MSNRIKVYLAFFSFFTFYIIKSCTINYWNDVRCDPRCRNRNCEALYSQYHCCDGCVPYVVAYYQERNLNTVTWASSLSPRCSEYCPPYQYEYYNSGNGYYTCEICDRNCTTCSGPTNI